MCAITFAPLASIQKSEKTSFLKLSKRVNAPEFGLN